jgi:hypothetical protein
LKPPYFPTDQNSRVGLSVQKLDSDGNTGTRDQKDPEYPCVTGGLAFAQHGRFLELSGERIIRQPEPGKGFSSIPTSPANSLGNKATTDWTHDWHRVSTELSQSVLERQGQELRSQGRQLRVPAPVELSGSELTEENNLILWKQGSPGPNKGPRL